MWWKKKLVPEKTPREQLIEERSDLECRIAMYEAGPRGLNFSGHSLEWPKLIAAIAKIDEKLAALDSGDAQGPA